MGGAYLPPFPATGFLWEDAPATYTPAACLGLLSYSAICLTYFLTLWDLMGLLWEGPVTVLPATASLTAGLLGSFSIPAYHTVPAAPDWAAQACLHLRGLFHHLLLPPACLPLLHHPLVPPHYLTPAPPAASPAFCDAPRMPALCLGPSAEDLGLCWDCIPATGKIRLLTACLPLFLHRCHLTAAGDWLLPG